jgi:mRNA-degrading endonuclease toxin of MazEF toxin-antitoxin module
MNRGDICLAWFPFTDSSGAKLRPVLVVSNAAQNQGDDIVVLPISSVPDKNDKNCVFIDKSWQHFAATGLRTSSSVKTSKPMTIAKVVVTRRLGNLHIDLLQLVTAKLIAVLS